MSCPTVSHQHHRRKTGQERGKAREYIAWIAARVRKLRTRPDYLPVIHIDVYGTIDFFSLLIFAARAGITSRA